MTESNDQGMRRSMISRRAALGKEADLIAVEVQVWACGNRLKLEKSAYLLQDAHCDVLTMLHRKLGLPKDDDNGGGRGGGEGRRGKERKSERLHLKGKPTLTQPWHVHL